MARILMTSFMLAASIVVLTSQSNAQSPDPALLAPGQSGRMLPAIFRVTTELRLRGASERVQVIQVSNRRAVIASINAHSLTARVRRLDGAAS
jgi:hypothetical protein